MSSEKSQVEEQATGTEVEETSWSYPFSKADVAAWKNEYGEDNIHLVELEEGNLYVMRGMFRKEFLTLQQSDFRNEEDLEDNFVHRACLYPQLNIMTLREDMAATSNRLFERLVQISNVDAQRTKEIVELTEKNLPANIDKADYQGWKGRVKGSKIYIVEFESKNFVYKGLKRSEYEKFRNKQREEGINQHDSENEVCTLATLFPIPKEFDPNSDDYLYGTIGSLSLMIMKVSGFGSTSVVTKL